MGQVKADAGGRRRCQEGGGGKDVKGGKWTLLPSAGGIQGLLLSDTMMGETDRLLVPKGEHLCRARCRAPAHIGTVSLPALSPGADKWASFGNPFPGHK